MKRVGRPGPKKKKKRKPPPCSLITITRRLKFKLDISKSVVVQKNKGTCFYLIYFFFFFLSLLCVEFFFVCSLSVESFRKGSGSGLNELEGSTAAVVFYRPTCECGCKGV